MKPKLLIFLLMIMIAPVFAETQPQQNNQEEYDFRQTRWGMTKEEVTKSEKLKMIFELNNKFFYKTSVANRNCNLIYDFENNSLKAGVYIFDIEHTNKNEYIDDYSTLQDMLVNKYGQPKENLKIWKNPLYKRMTCLIGD